ncbi:MAG: TadE/TadG family type IV pilus assembly protein [Ktedonobacterales bacterium]
MSYTVSSQRMGRERSRRRGFQRRMRSGQTLVIFALSFTVLLGMAGLVIDVGRAYDLYASMQRAAEAGALAGVLYMPNYFDTMRPSTTGDNNCAFTRASQEVYKNGFGVVATSCDGSLSMCLSESDMANGAIVTMCQVTGKTDDLQVSVSQTLDLVLLSGLGVQPVTLTATAQADYLPPSPLGARLNYFGDQVECYNNSDFDPTDTTSCPINSSQVHLQSFLASFIGPSELKEFGDPYVYCEEGAAYTSTLDGTNTYTTYNGYTTNHPQYTDSITNHCGEPNPGVTAGNPDQQPNGYSGVATTNTAHPGGYNFLVTIPQSVGSNADIWIYNPSYIPSATGGAFDHFIGNNSTYYMGPSGNGIINPPAGPGFDGYYDAPPFYYTITYSLYPVNSLWDRASDGKPVSVAYPPYDAMPNDLTEEGCGSGYVYDPYWKQGATPNSYNLPVGTGGCFQLNTMSPGNVSPWEPGAPAPCWQQWCTLPIGTNLSAGTYRLVIEATGLTSSASAYSSDTTSGYGEHVYALKVCKTGLTSPISCSDLGSPGLQIAAWNDMDVYFSSQLSTQGPTSGNPSTTCVTQTSGLVPYTCLDLACIPTAYAGRTLSLQIFDPGDGSGDIYVGVAEAGVGSGSVTYPWLPGSDIVMKDGDSVVQAHFSSPSYNALNGLWLIAQVTLPSTYTGDCQANGTGWWQMIYATDNGGSPSDTVGVEVSLAGSPIHLVPPS